MATHTDQLIASFILSPQPLPAPMLRTVPSCRHMLTASQIQLFAAYTITQGT
jgi:hypothetical protein